MESRSKAHLLKTFAALYPDPKSELNFVNPYQLLIAVMLSAQCTDKKVNEITPSLFSKFPSFAELSRARLAEIENIIRPINYYKTKSRHLIAAAKLIAQEFGGALPQSHDALTRLPGVGRKTANVILNELGIEPRFPVDTHVFRVSRRLGLARGGTPEAVEEELKRQFKSATWRNLHHWLILHGRRVCKAQRPACVACKLARVCPSATV